MNCQICGNQVVPSQSECANCGSRVAGETGNPFTGGRVVNPALIAVGAFLAVVSIVVSSVLFATAGSSVASNLLANTRLPFGQSALPGNSLLPDTGFSKQGAAGGTDYVDPNGGGIDGGGTDSGTDYGYSLSSAQAADGLQLWGSTPVAWRWATTSEMNSLTCESTTCTFMYVETVDTCSALSVQSDVEDAETNGNYVDSGSGYGNNDEYNNYVPSGSSQFIEVGTTGSWDYDVWFSITDISCN